jgi:fluoroquinolone resistance protein
MALPIFEQLQLKGINHQEHPLEAGEYEDCQFTNCNLEKIILTGFRFSNCVFKDCNLSLAEVHQTAFRSVQMDACKLLGIHFEDCSPFGWELFFKDCQLDNSFFSEMNLQGSRFEGCSLRQVDFTGADLKKIRFHQCDLQNALFENCQLYETDFRTAYHYTFDPAKNRLKKTRFSREGLEGLLRSFDIVVE